MFVRRKDLDKGSNRSDESALNKPIFESRFGSVRGSVWEHASQTGEVFCTISYRRVRKDGAETRFPNSFYPNDVHDLTFVAYECYNWLSAYYGENPSQE